MGLENCLQQLASDLFNDHGESAEPDPRLGLLDCWRALEKGQSKGWIRRPSTHAPYLWGKIDIEAYTYYDDPLHADLHEIVPGEI